MATFELYIGGTLRNEYLRAGGFSLTRQANARQTLSLAFIDDAGLWYPSPADAVYITEDGTKIFGGIITRVRRYTQGQPALMSEASCEDYVSITNRRRMREESYGPDYLGNIVTAVLTARCAGEGLTTTAVEQGPMVNERVKANYETVTAFINKLCEQYGAGAIWWIDPDKGVHLTTQSAAPAAPFALEQPGGDWADLEIEESCENYRNVEIAITNTGTDSGHTYASISENASEIAAHGRWESADNAPEAATRATLDAFSAGTLAANDDFETRITTRTDRTGLLPGQKITVNVPTRYQVSGDFYIESISSQEIGKTLLRHTITATKLFASTSAVKKLVDIAYGSMSAPPHYEGATLHQYATITPALAADTYTVRRSGIPTQAWAVVGTAPVGADVIADVIHYRGEVSLGSIFADGAKLTVPAGQTVSVPIADFYNGIEFNEGDRLVLEVDQAGSTTEGEDLDVAVQWHGHAIKPLCAHFILGENNGSGDQDVYVGDDLTNHPEVFAGTPFRIRSNIKTAPVGADIIFDILKNGVSILNDSIHLADGDTSVESADVITGTTFADRDQLSINVTQVGSTTAGKAMTVYVDYMPEQQQ